MPKRAWFGVLAALVLSGSVTEVVAQYRSPRDYMKRIEPLTPPAQQPAKRAPAPAPPASAPAQLVVPPSDPAKAKADKAAAVQRAVAFERKQAEAGAAWAQYDLGMRYLNGDGVGIDYEAGRGWIEKAALNRYEKAVKQLERMKEAERTAAPPEKGGDKSKQPTAAPKGPGST